MCRGLVYLILSAAMLCFATKAGAAGTLVGYWAFDDGAGTTAADSSGKDNHGQLVGDPQWVDGKIAGALEFDGVGTIVDIPYSPEMTPSQGATISCWAFPTDTTRACLIGQFEGYGMALMGGLQLKSVVWGSDWVLTDVTIPEREWSHITMTWDVANSERMVFLNGEAVGQRGDSAVPSVQNNLGIGLWVGWPEAWGDDSFAGIIDEARLYNRVLTAGHVLDLFHGVSPTFLKAERPDPADGARGVTMPLLQWSPGETGLFHNVYLGTGPELTEADQVGARLPFTMYYHVMGLQPGVTYYWRVDEVEGDLVTIHTGDVWSFTAMPLTAWTPAPADGAEQVLLTPTLSWTPGQGAVGHHLYLGADFDAVSAGGAETDMGEMPGGATSYEVTTSLEMNTTYYWRVDGTNMAGTVQAGEVWSFTTVSPGPGGAIRQWWLGVTGTDVATLTGDARYPDDPDGEELVALMEGPIDWADDYGSRIYGWLYPQASGDYTFWIASDDQGELWLSTDADPANAVLIAGVEGWVPSRDFYGTTGVPGARQQSALITLQASQVYYIEALMNEGAGGDNIAVAWQGPGVPFGVIGSDVVGPTSTYPLGAFAPSPADGAVDTIQSPTLSWLAGQGATQHAVYLGDDADAVANADTSTAGIFRGQQAGTTYNAGPLEWGKTYYWRVDENSAAEPGKVWSFTTANFLKVEDFESYDDDIDGGTAIFQTWIDGVENGTGSYVGYEVANNGTFGETTTVHGGGQSMPLDYNNVAAPYYSETDRTFAVPEDWTVNGVNTLTLYIRGSAGNDPVPLYVVVEDSAGRVGVAVHRDPAITTYTQWSRWEIPLIAFSDAGVNLAAVGKICIGLGDRAAPTPGGTGLIYVDDIQVTRP